MLRYEDGPLEGFLRLPSDAYALGGRAYAVRGEASGFFAAGVHMALLSQVAATPQTPAAPPPGHRLGDLSMRYETGYTPDQFRLAAAKVSSGRGGISSKVPNPCSTWCA